MSNNTITGTTTSSTILVTNPTTTSNTITTTTGIDYFNPLLQAIKINVDDFKINDDDLKKITIPAASTNSSSNFKIHDHNEFKNIKELVPEKVYEFTFYDGTKIKTICDEYDLFNLEYAFYLALAKKLFSSTYTFEGVLNQANQFKYQKYYAKLVKNGIKLFNKLQKERAKEKENEEIRKRQHKRYIRRKKEAKERKKNAQIKLIADAIRLSKEEG